MVFSHKLPRSLVSGKEEKEGAGHSLGSQPQHLVAKLCLLLSGLWVMALASGLELWADETLAPAAFAPFC